MLHSACLLEARLCARCCRPNFVLHLPRATTTGRRTYRDNDIVDVWSKTRGRSRWHAEPNDAENVDELDDIVAEDLLFYCTL